MYTGSSSPGARWLSVGQVTDCLTKKKPNTKNPNKTPNQQWNPLCRFEGHWFLFLHPTSSLLLSTGHLHLPLPISSLPPQHFFSPTNSPRAALLGACPSSRRAFPARYGKASGRSVPGIVLKQGHAEALGLWGAALNSKSRLDFPPVTCRWSGLTGMLAAPGTVHLLLLRAPSV